MNNAAPKLLRSVVARTERFAQLQEPHVAPLTDYVLRLLRGKGNGHSIPFFDPWDGGIGARILFLLEAPGPKAVESGFVSQDNNDETAKNFGMLSREAGIDRQQTVIWNIVPWYLGDGKRIRAATKADIVEGLTYIESLLDLLPHLHTAVLVGRKAGRARERIAKLRPRLEILESPHPSPVFVNRKLGNRAAVLESLGSASLRLAALGTSSAQNEPNRRIEHEHARGDFN